MVYSKKIRGKRTAVVTFPSEGDQKKAYDASTLKKLGPQRLQYGGGKPKGGGKNSQITISNLPPGIKDDDILKKFPDAVGVKIDKATGTAVVQFKNPADTKKAYDDSDLMKLGKNKLQWIRPEEIYLMDVPKTIKDKDMMKEFPDAKKVKWIKGEG